MSVVVRIACGIALPLIAGMLFACVSIRGAEPVIEPLAALRGDYFPITSARTQRKYHINVRLPEGYDSAKATTYPVVYVLDGDSLFPLLAPTHLFLQNDEGIPAAIIVGISYGSFEPEINKRAVDFGAVGAPRFLAFLKNELIPRIERDYAANPARRILIGQSLGGHFVLWSAIEDPNLFWASIASNASFGEFAAGLRRPPATPSRHEGQVALVSGTRDYRPQRLQEAREWVAHWTAQPDAPWKLRHLVIDGGTHAASIGQAYRDAMVWLFRSSAFTDPSPHQARFIEVQPNVKLEVLDWGGAGRDVILLAGMGHSAHAFDDFAPKLARSARVIGITRRGHFPSDSPAEGYDPDRLADDIAEVVTQLDLKAPVLIGHSIASEELNTFTTRFPARAAGLVYLDAAYDRTDTGLRSMGPLESRIAPRPSASDLVNFDSVTRWLRSIRGSGLPVAEERLCCEWDENDKFLRFRSSASPAGEKMLAGVRTPPYTRIRIPTLAFFRVLGSVKDFDGYRSDNHAAFQAVFDAWQPVQRAQIERYRTQVAQSKVIDLLASTHHLYVSDENRILSEVANFIEKLDAAP